MKDVELNGQTSTPKASSEASKGTCDGEYWKGHSWRSVAAHEKTEHCINWKPIAAPASAPPTIEECPLCNERFKHASSRGGDIAVQLFYRGGNGKTRSYHMGCIIKLVEGRVSAQEATPVDPVRALLEGMAIGESQQLTRVSEKVWKLTPCWKEGNKNG